MSWLQQTDEQQRQDEEEMKSDWDNWISREPAWWRIQEHRKWLEEQDGQK